MFSVRFSDGPKGPLVGGALKSGSLVTDPFVAWDIAVGGIDWKSVKEQIPPIMKGIIA
ncbi:MAG: hypothetical protein ACJA2D_002866 [Pseudohongiellaceae bacterium]